MAVRFTLAWAGISGHQLTKIRLFASDKYYRDNSHKQAGSIDGSQMFLMVISLFGGGIPDILATAAPETEYEGSSSADLPVERSRRIYRVTDWADVNLKQNVATPLCLASLRTNFNDLFVPQR